MYFLYWILNYISKHTCHVSLLYVLIKSLETTGIGNDEVYVCVCVCVPATATAQDYLFLWKITTPLIKCLLVKGTWYQLCPVRFFSEVKKNWKLTSITVGYRMCNCSSIPHIYLGVCRIDFETFTIVSIF